MPVTDDINDVPLAFDIDDLMHVYDRLRRNAFDPSKSMIDTMASLLRQSAALLRIHVPQSHKLRSLFTAREIEAREREEAESRLAANWCKAGPVADAGHYEVPDDDDTFGQGESDAAGHDAFWRDLYSGDPVKVETDPDVKAEKPHVFIGYHSRPDVVGPAFEARLAAEWEVGR